MNFALAAPLTVWLRAMFHDGSTASSSNDRCAAINMKRPPQSCHWCQSGVKTPAELNSWGNWHPLLSNVDHLLLPKGANTRSFSVTQGSVERALSCRFRSFWSCFYKCVKMSPNQRREVVKYKYLVTVLKQISSVICTCLENFNYKQLFVLPHTFVHKYLSFEKHAYCFDKLCKILFKQSLFVLCCSCCLNDIV